MSVSEVAGRPDVSVVDTNLLGMPGVMSAFLVDGQRTALVDAGAAPAADRVREGLASVGVSPADLDYLLPTHVHLDHAGAVGELARECPNATVLVPESGHEYLVDPDGLSSLADSARRALGDLADGYGDPRTVPPERCETISDGDEVDLGDRTLRVVGAPGHAPHQVCLFDDRDGTLFAADAAGMSLAGGLYPSTPPPDFDLETSLDTLDRLVSLEPSVVCYGHFGARSDGVAALREYRSVLPEWVEAVRDATADHDDREAVVAALGREWPMPTLRSDVAGVMRYLDRRAPAKP